MKRCSGKHRLSGLRVSEGAAHKSIPREIHADKRCAIEDSVENSGLSLQFLQRLLHSFRMLFKVPTTETLEGKCRPFAALDGAWGDLEHICIAYMILPMGSRWESAQSLQKHACQFSTNRVLFWICVMHAVEFWHMGINQDSTMSAIYVERTYTCAVCVASTHPGHTGTVPRTWRNMS